MPNKSIHTYLSLSFLSSLSLSLSLSRSLSRLSLNNQQVEHDADSSTSALVEINEARLEYVIIKMAHGIVGRSHRPQHLQCYTFRGGDNSA